MQGNAEAILIGSNTHIRGQLVVFPHGGRIQIGNCCFVGEGSRIWSGASVVIGHRVLISHGVNIHDTVSHSFSAVRRHEHFNQIVTTGFPRVLEEVPAQAPITIEDDVWLGFSSSVLRGVSIGRGAIVGAASVVTKNVAPFSIVVGNPARVVGEAQP
jgi:maltose O-acetyltransferase